MNQTKKLLSNVSALFLLQLANYILPFLLIPFLTRTLGVSLYGVVAFGLAMVQIGCIITDFGFNLSATRQIARNQSDRELVRRLVGAVHLCKIFLLAPVALLFFLLLHYQEQKYGEYTTFFWLLLIPIAGQTFQPIWFFQGMERMGLITLFVVLARSSYVLLALFFVTGPEDYWWVAVANGIAQTLSAILAVGFMIRLGYAPIWPGWGFTRSIFSNSIEFFWSRAAVTTYTAGGAFYLGLLSSTSVVAYYSAAEQLYKGAQALFQPISQALFPYMARTHNTKIFKTILFFCVLMAGVGALTGIIIGEHLLALLFGPEYIQSYEILIYFMVCFLITTPSILLGYPFLSALGDSRSANLSVIYGGAIQAILLLVLWQANWISGKAVVLSIICVESFVLIYRATKARSILSSGV